ncbi:outer spore coat protein CotE [Paenibacillus sp. KN14-4R]|uniref:outer spore coat protein CotE n=1 Tax=Paenibacillus sp. KN14-4R TaxID=3445773 RepID=UPI003F9FBD2A
MSIDKDLQSREIITKAVCGKGRRFSHVSHTVTPSHAPTSILGAWIINNQYEAVKSGGDGVEVVGTYDINIWYSYDRNTKTDVAKETISYVEVVPLSYLDKRHRVSTAEVSALATQEPNCVEASVASGGRVIIRVEREFQVEMVAETKVSVYVNPRGFMDSDDKVADFDDSSIEGDYEDLDPDMLEDDFS